MRQYTQDEIWKIYEKLPEELREAIFLEETADYIFNSCERNNVEAVSRVAYYTGLVLMGLILPQEFSETLKKEVGLSKTLAEAIAREINRFVFYPVKPALEQIHNMEMGQAEKPAENPQGIQAGPPQSRQQASLGREDTYKEPID